MNKKFVSRAGDKLEAALKTFDIDVSEKTCADLGCSTGGFTDCLLQNGAKKVYAIDTAYGELAYKLRIDPRVVVNERTNALYTELPEKVDVVVIDVGWTKQKVVIPKALELVKKGGVIVSLLKPQYEADDSQRKKGKVSEEYLQQIVENVKIDLSGFSIELIDIVESPILGDKAKNTEFLIYAKPIVD